MARYAAGAAIPGGADRARYCGGSRSTTRLFGKGYEDRTIDIDFLWFDGVVSSTAALTIPHPLAHQRAFVLVPWCELAPELLLREHTLTQWLARCRSLK